MKLVALGQCSKVTWGLFTLYDKDEMDDLTAKERDLLAAMLKSEIQARTS